MKANNGFTLIEVLIAAIILFSSLAITAQLFSASSLSADKAAATAQYYQQSELVITTIKSQLRERFKRNKNADLQGEIEAAGQIYSWQALKTASITPPARIDDIDLPEPRFARFLVTVELINKGKSFQFETVAW
ncbi:type II secretion system protein [Pseudoalteromonas aliena]|uniref:PilW family protein n=1 Tax=Pseudoalteromonas aliena TaxID=247523 RepID=UPI00311F5EEB